MISISYRQPMLENYQKYFKRKYDEKRFVLLENKFRIMRTFDVTIDQKGL